jgi:hypothetical protein
MRVVGTDPVPFKSPCTIPSRGFRMARCTAPLGSCLHGDWCAVSCISGRKAAQ